MVAVAATHQAHARAVQALQASYAAVPPDQPVRLAKRTSNLFRPRAPRSGAGLDVSGLGGVLDVDPVARTADVQGMCTYERLVDATLAHGLMPLVVPQLKTITLGGAVTGLGIESTSFRNGLPHESVTELDVLTGDGRVVTASATEHADLFAAFPNSYGSLGYAVRLRIELEPVQPYVALCATSASTRSTDWPRRWSPSARAATGGEHDGEPVHFVDGVMFSPDESYLTLGRWSADARSGRATTPATQIYYRSIRERSRDLLTVRDYLWRWDTDWFWCSAASVPSTQQPVGSGRCGTGAATSTTGWWRWRTGGARWRGWTGCAGGRRASASYRTSRSRWSARRTSSAGSPITSPCRRCGCVRSGCARRARLGAAVAALPAERRSAVRQRRLLGDRADHRRAPRRGREQAGRGRASLTSAGTSRCTPTPTTTRRRSTRSTVARPTEPSRTPTTRSTG